MAYYSENNVLKEYVKVVRSRSLQNKGKLIKMWITFEIN